MKVRLHMSFVNHADDKGVKITFLDPENASIEMMHLMIPSAEFGKLLSQESPSYGTIQHYIKGSFDEA